MIEKILSEYGLAGFKVRTPQSGYRNASYPVELANGAVANLILYKSESGILAKIRNANRVSNFLAGQGFPTRQTLEARIVRLSSPGRVKYGALYTYLPGNTIPWEAYTMEHIKLLGQSMADLHAALRKLPDAQRLPVVTDEYLAIVGRMRHYFSDTKVIEATNHKLRIILNYQLLTRYQQLLQACTNLPGHQALHMDLVRSNVLFTESVEPAVTGIIDFEKASYGHPVFDIARTLAFLLVDCKYKTGTQVKKYFLYSGYSKRGNGTIPNQRLLTELTNLFLLYDFYKFLRHNPYESLASNEHFVRTRDILLARGLVSKVSSGSRFAAGVSNPL